MEEAETFARDILLRALIAAHPDPAKLREAFEKQAARAWTALALERPSHPPEASDLMKSALTEVLDGWRLYLHPGDDSPRE